MSRYALPARAPGYDVVVGYDRPMNAYFAQVYDHDGEIVLDCGDAVDRLLHPRQAIDAVRAHAAEIPAGLEEELLRTARSQTHPDLVLYFLPALCETHAVYLGWNPQERTFFAAVQDADDQVLVARGFNGDLLLSADSTVDVVREFTSLGGGLESDLLETLRGAA